LFQSTHINVLTYHICTSYITVAARKAEQNFRQTNVFQRIHDDDDDMMKMMMMMMMMIMIIIIIINL